ncbi:MAG TPA: RNA polymerase factor sigma-32 [Polyangia bacterium]|jgi:RNA polymerase sigma-32 factor
MARLAEDEGFQTYLSAIQRFQPLDRATELKLARRWQRRHDADSAHRLVQAHLRFVVKIANSYRGYGLKVADLVEEGNIGLLEAVRRFDPSRNLRFMTYAAYWIRAYILAHVLKQWSMVGVGTGPMQSKLFFRMARERAKITSALGAGATETDVEELLAKKFGTSPERIRNMTGRLDGKDLSLDVAAYRDGTATGLDLLADDVSEGQEDRAARLERDEVVRTRVGALLRGLSPRERHILDHRLLTDDAETLADIGRQLGLSRERVRQLEERLKIKLRRALADFEPEPLRA